MSIHVRFHHIAMGDPGHQPLVCLHGFLGNTGDWLDVFDELSERYHCHAVDLPGHGRTRTDDPAAFRMPECAAAFLEWMDSLGIRMAHLLGYSMGGRLALYLALKHPERFRRLVLESASPGLENEPERAARREHDQTLARRLENGPLEAFLDDWYRQPLFKTLHADPARLAELQSRRNRQDSHGLARSLREMGTGAQPALWAELPGLQTPTLAIVGELDTRFRVIADRMATKSVQISVKAVANAGHNVHLEQTGAFVREIVSFFDSGSLGSS